MALLAACAAAAASVEPCFAASATAAPISLGVDAGHSLQDVLDRARVKSGAPGASAAIMIDGRVVWTGASGFADAATRTPVSATTMYSLASVTKTFVATMVLRLAEDGRLRIDDPIAPYVPDYLPSAHKVTIRDLLGHTSGYADVEGFPVILHWLDDPNHRWERDQVLRQVQPVHFKPGTRFEYSNTNYIILGAIIERASEASVGENFARYITGPLKLGGDVDIERIQRYAGRIAHGYDLQKKRLVDTFAGAHDLAVPTADWGPVWTDGGIVATATGVARFTDALYGGRILRPATLAEMRKAGPDHSYGLGTLRMPFDGHAWQGHDGFYYGFTTETYYDFSRRLTITVLTNRTDDSDPASAIWNRLAAAYDRER